jgi:hypothetical protein
VVVEEPKREQVILVMPDSYSPTTPYCNFPTASMKEHTQKWVVMSNHFYSYVFILSQYYKNQFVTLILRQRE